MPINLGMDFGQLAQIASPGQWNPGPLGPGAQDGLAFGRREVEQRNLLQQAAEQAKLEAEYKAKLAGEEMSPEAVEHRRLGREKTKLDVTLLQQRLKSELQKEENRPIEEAVNIYAGGEGSLEDAIEHIRMKKPDMKFFNHIFGVDKKIDAQRLAGMWKAKVDTPQHAQKKELKSADNETKLLLSAAKSSEGALNREHQRQLQEARLAAQAARDLSRRTGKEEKPAKSLQELRTRYKALMDADPSLVPKLMPHYEEINDLISKENIEKATAGMQLKLDALQKRIDSLLGNRGSTGNTSSTGSSKSVGTKDNPATTREQYDKLKSGEYYIHPKDGKLTRKP